MKKIAFSEYEKELILLAIRDRMDFLHQRLSRNFHDSERKREQYKMELEDLAAIGKKLWKVPKIPKYTL